MWNCPVRKDGSSCVSILLFIILTNELILFLIEFMINSAYISPFTFLSPRFFYPLFGVSQLWLFLSKSGDIDVFKLVFPCWHQLIFTRNLEIFSAKKLKPLIFKCSLLSFECLLVAVLSSSERNQIFLSLHISIRRWFASFALLFKSSSFGTMSDSYTVIIIFQWRRLIYRSFCNLTGCIFSS